MRCLPLSSSAKSVGGKGGRADSGLPREMAVRTPDNCFLCDEAATLACQDCCRVRVHLMYVGVAWSVPG